MYQPINSEGLTRLAHLELTRFNPKTQDEARRHLIKRLGAYDHDGIIIERSLETYYNLPA
ncbi:hypothetical protein QGN29_12865 [Temperatibacter marinus]|uniref:Uncharacterized protein n=1 Tax=Temperatibacter marinus TaxID=1456591 RepID=A0AA52H9F2_9PROT|nr:hypothetical protein [Temperatibacter marinus]WND02437.1 hypothetical protein QGN29_12865 [Temperatibacter marinus]